MSPRELLCERQNCLGTERQRLLMFPPVMDHLQEEEQGDVVGEDSGNCELNGQRQLPPAVVLVAQGFWEAVQLRRELSNIEASTDAAALSRRQRSTWLALLFGQVIAFIAASVNATSFTLENKFGVVTPMIQLFLMYAFLSIHLFFRSRPLRDDDESFYYYECRCHCSSMPIILRRLCPCWRLTLQIPWYFYFLMSCLDVGAGVIMLLSLQYTSLTSVSLLSSLTVPSTMLFSKLLLGKSFYFHHFVGVCLCLVGGCLTIWADLGIQGQTTNTTTHAVAAADADASFVTHPLSSMTMNIGDFMAITAALLYGLGDAVSEYSIKHIDRNEFLGMLGLFGMLLTGLQFPFQERDTLSRLLSDPAANQNALLLMGGYVALLLLYYVAEASFLVSSDATLLNLSLQAQNLWAILFSILTYQAAPPLLFYLAVILVAVGFFAYEVGPSSDGVIHALQNDDKDACGKQVRQEDKDALDVAGGSQVLKPMQCSVQYSPVQQAEGLQQIL